MAEDVGVNTQRAFPADRLRGAVRYAADLSDPAMLHAVPVLAPAPSALLLGVDSAVAERAPGVLRVLTAADVPGSNRFGPIAKSQPVLVAPGERIRYWGDTVALVVAETEAAARRAAALVRVDHQEVTGVYDPVEGLLPGAPLVYEDCPQNVCAEDALLFGDPESELARAEVVVDCELHIPAQEHAFLETEAAFVSFDAAGRLVLASCMQDPFYFRHEIAQAVGLPLDELRVVATAMGGAFGGKEEVTLQAHAVVAAWATGRPVRMVYSREESFRVHPKRHPMTMRGWLGASRRGDVTAFEVDFVGDAGAYMGKSPVVLSIVLHALGGPYFLPNARFHGRMVYTNNTPNGACRGYGQPQACLIREVLFDRLAERLGMDPAVLRERNALTVGQTATTPWVVMDRPSGLGRVMREALRLAGEPPVLPRPGFVTGRGLAAAMPLFDRASLPAGDMRDRTALVEMRSDGSVRACASGVDFGQGIGETLAILVAEVFGLDPARVELVLGDTDECPNTGPTVASRQTCVSGGALVSAAQQIKVRLAERGAELLGVPPDRLVFAGGAVYAAGEAERSVSVSQLARALRAEGVELRVEGAAPRTAAAIGHTFVATVADVEVDTLTGKIRVTQLSLAHEIGRAINPPAARGQIIGGASMNTGWMLREGFSHFSGRPVTPTMGEYLIGTAEEMPWVEVSLLEDDGIGTGNGEETDLLRGVRGVAEHGSMSTAPAILNAIKDACAVRADLLPVTPERLLEALSGATEGSKRGRP